MAALVIYYGRSEIKRAADKRDNRAWCLAQAQLIQDDLRS